MSSQEAPEDNQENDSFPVPTMDRGAIPKQRKSMIPVLSPNHVKKDRNTNYNKYMENRFRVNLQVTKIGPTALECISSQTMNRILAGDFLYMVKYARIIDCRFPYEYEGGHIQSATNLYRKQHLLSLFQDIVVEYTNKMICKEIIIIHCEFSSKRGPRMLSYWNDLRNEFEAVHGSNRVQFPKAYLLNGGYKRFFSHFPQSCTPSGYVQMIDSRYYKEFYDYYSKCKGENDLLLVQKNNKYLN